MSRDERIERGGGGDKERASEKERERGGSCFHNIRDQCPCAGKGKGLL
jgi:hypothetical protein